MRSAFGKKLFGSGLAQSCGALVAMVAHTAPATAGDLVFFDDQAVFEQANEDAGNQQKGVEDFEESVLPPLAIVPIDDPLEPGVANGPFLNGLEGLDNIQVQSNVLGPNPFDPAPFGPNGMLALAAGAFGVTSDVVVHNFATHSYDIILLDAATISVGFNPVAFSGGQVNVRVYDTANNFLGESLFNADPFATKFAGVISTVPIGRINIFDPVRGGGDNIQKWVNCLQIQNVNQGTFHCTIQDAIDTADGGDEIVVQEGTYFENINFLGKAITLRSTDPTDPAVVAATIIDAAGSGRVVNCNSGEGPETVLSGFTITGGNATHGAGMQNSAGSSPTVANCAFIDNAATNGGGGMRNSTSSNPMITNCTFSGNEANNGAGMVNALSSNPMIINCTFIGNTADFSGGAIWTQSSSPTVTNCTFSGNTAGDHGGGMWNNISSPTVTNCTFSGNSAGGFGGGMVNIQGSNATVTNCILWGDSPDEIFNDGSTPIVTYSNVQGGFAGTGNIDADPLFVDPDNDDLRLGSCSPSTDAGDNDAVPDGITTDLDGNPRFVDDAGVADTGNGDGPIVDMGAYERQVDSPPALINVPADFATIQEAIDADICTGGEIVVQEGTYFENINFNGNAITLRSTDPTDPAVVAATIIDGGGVDSVVTCNSGEGAGTILSGFTITGGNATDGGGMKNEGSSPTVTHCTFSGNAATLGGGMGNDSSNPTVSNCTFSGNTAILGGGMHNIASSPVVTNCTFSGNAANGGFGGGMFLENSSSPTVTNCTFTGNTATNEGGGMYIQESSPTLTNCTFSGNTASDGGGMYNFNNSNSTVTNCILWGDSPDEIFNDNSTSTVTYSNVQGGFAGEGNIDADPLFEDPDNDDLRLGCSSPSTDAGDNDAVPDGITTDLDDNPRFVDDAGVADTGNGDGPIVDMGAYERQVDSGGGVVNVPADFATIQEAIDAACPSAEIIVQEGTYFENINFNGKAITLRSTDPTDPAVVAATIIDGGGSGRVVHCNSGEGPDTVLSGFTITGGNAPNGAGMQNGAGSSPTVTHCTFIDNVADLKGGGMRNLNGSSPTVTNCIFSGNIAKSIGGGMSNGNNSNPTVTDCTFSGNSATIGGGMINQNSDPTVTNCIFSGNSASAGGGGGMENTSSDPTVTNCIFSGNTATLNGGGMDNAFSSSPTVTNCTFSGNMATSAGGGMRNATNSNPAVTNCILWGDTPNELSGAGTPIVTYSNVQGGFAGTGNIDADPLFVDPDDDDLRLGCSSPSTDAGDNDAVPDGITTDLDDNPRFVDDAGVADTGNGDGPIVDMGAYERQVDSPSGVINVPADFATIQEAIDAACPSAEIIVQQGTYFENINFLGKAITLRSTDPTDPAVVAATIIDADGSGRVVHCNSGEGPDTVLSGFTITGGNTSDGAGMQNGAGSSPTVTHCTFLDNAAALFGGGMYNAGSNPTVTNCTFIGNTADLVHGGGMYNVQSSPTVTNCTFSGNTANFNGGGMYNAESSPTVTNCTFSGNEASGVGGGMYNVLKSSPTVTNCILWGDSPDEIFDDGTTTTVTYSNVQGGFAGEGNIDADPMFVDPDNDDLRLLAGSPCIDAADNTAPDLAGITEDLDGLPRFVDDPETEDTGRCDDPCERPVVDMGAYEFQAGAGGCIRDPEWLCDGDVDGDGQVNPVDSGLVQAAFGSTEEGDLCQYDLDCDGQINPVDSGIVQSLFGTCEAPRGVCP